MTTLTLLERLNEAYSWVEKTNLYHELREAVIERDRLRLALDESEATLLETRRVLMRDPAKPLLVCGLTLPEIMEFKRQKQLREEL